MPRIEIREAAVWVGDERIPLVAGEVHYWRLNPARWGHILDRCLQLGVRVVATYVPWEYHEVAPGSFDFTGHTEPPRNLLGFLEQAAQRGLWVMIRPGPYIYSEWTNAGVPDRVVTLPRIGNAYRREARVWMEAVTAALTPHLATRGGRIVLFMADNEFDLFSHWFEDEAGLSGTQTGFFQQFAAETYGDIAALNAAWGTQHTSFATVRPLATRVNNFDPHALCRHKDYWRFQHWATAQGLGWHAAEYRRLGVDVPIVGNYYPGGDVQNWRENAKVVDAVGIDWYPKNEFGGDAQHHRRFLDTCRYQRAISPLPHIAELECGVWHGFHDYVGNLTPNHYRLMICSAFLAGIQGFNWYMLVGRDNWYYTPVNERGDLRLELSEVIARAHQVFEAADFPRLEKLTQTCALLEPLHIGTERALNQDPVLDALYAAGVDFEVCDAELARITQPLMFYTGADWLSRASQARLAADMEAGGTLVVFQQHHPQRDDLFQPHNGLGIVPPDRVLSPLGKKVELQLGAHTGIGEGAVWNWDNPPGEALVGTQVAGQQQAVENADKWMTHYIGKQWVCGYREARGRGALVVIGLPPSASLVRALHRWLGVPLGAEPEVGGIQTALFRAADGSYVLVATSLNEGPLQTRVTFDGVTLPARVRVHDLWEDRVVETTLDAVHIALPRRGGGVWRISGTRT